VERPAGHPRVPGPRLGRLQRRQQAEAERGNGASGGAARPLPGRAEHGGGPCSAPPPLAGHPGCPAERTVRRSDLTQVTNLRISQFSLPCHKMPF
jgi:hypothetical protein